MQTLRINSSRLQKDFDELAQIGTTGDGGVNRPTFSESHLAARAWFRARTLADGLEFRQDAAGNHSAILRTPQPDAKTLLLGSHLDSVPNGGRFDGALGVLAALEVLRTVKEAGLDLPVHLEAIDFTDEEGTLIGLMGSQALIGKLSPAELAKPRGGRAPFEEGLTRAGLDEAVIPTAARSRESLVAFLEIHIEQGPRLQTSKCDIGIVTNIVGINANKLTFTGRADHAGTTPMDARRDAGLGAATLMLRAREEVMRDFQNCVINFGQISFSPGAYNIVPERAELAMEYRAPSQLELEMLKSRLIDIAQQTAQQLNLKLESEESGCVRATPCSLKVQDAFTAACNTLNLRATRLTSGAGHDTMSLAQICPAGMIFIPSTGGSHNPGEFARWEDCVNGANVLLQAALELAK
ncbi:MAG: Zn-dependent hydrolase [Anaerolineales bacterium]|nr:Zn-dependent hydrolase [Anaerolineales bacterium]